MESCKERKRFLSGTEVTYNCELLFLGNEFGILKYLVNHQQQVGSLTLQAGTISYGFYWSDRPYTLYKWFGKNGQVIGNYFNLADSVILSIEEFSWRDLIVDILILPTGQVEILDQDEVPAFIDKELRSYIESGKQMLLQNYRTIISETTAILRCHV